MPDADSYFKSGFHCSNGRQKKTLQLVRKDFPNSAISNYPNKKLCLG